MYQKKPPFQLIIFLFMPHRTTRTRSALMAAAILTSSLALVEELLTSHLCNDCGLGEYKLYIAFCFVVNLVKCFFYMVQMTVVCLFINVWLVALILLMHHAFNHLAI